MYIVFQDGENHYGVVTVPKSLVDLTLVLVHYFRQRPLAPHHLHRQMVVVDYGKGPFLFRQGQPVVQWDFGRVVHDTRYFRYLSEPYSDGPIVANETFWDNLPERVSDYLIATWEKMPTALPRYKEYHNQKWPK